MRDTIEKEAVEARELRIFAALFGMILQPIELIPITCRSECVPIPENPTEAPILVAFVEISQQRGGLDDVRRRGKPPGILAAPQLARLLGVDNARGQIGSQRTRNRLAPRANSRVHPAHPFPGIDPCARIPDVDVMIIRGPVVSTQGSSAGVVEQQAVRVQFAHEVIHDLFEPDDTLGALEISEIEPGVFGEQVQHRHRGGIPVAADKFPPVPLVQIKGCLIAYPNARYPRPRATDHNPHPVGPIYKARIHRTENPPQRHNIQFLGHSNGVDELFVTERLVGGRIGPVHFVGAMCRRLIDPAARDVNRPVVQIKFVAARLDLAHPEPGCRLINDRPTLIGQDCVDLVEVRVVQLPQDRIVDFEAQGQLFRFRLGRGRQHDRRLLLKGAALGFVQRHPQSERCDFGLGGGIDLDPRLGRLAIDVGDHVDVAYHHRPSHLNPRLAAQAAQGDDLLGAPRPHPALRVADPHRHRVGLARAHLRGDFKLERRAVHLVLADILTVDPNLGLEVHTLEMDQHSLWVGLRGQSKGPLIPRHSQVFTQIGTGQLPGQGRHDGSPGDRPGLEPFFLFTDLARIGLKLPLAIQGDHARPFDVGDDFRPGTPIRRRAG